MLPAMFALLFAVAAPPAKAHAPLCVAGKAALSDLIAKDGSGNHEEYFDGRSRTGKPNLLTLCPGLMTVLPDRIRLVTPDALAQVKNPMRGRPVTIFFIEPPVLAPDGRHATIEMGYSCTGLCGFGATVEYVLKDGHWTQGRTLWVIVS